MMSRDSQYKHPWGKVIESDLDKLADLHKGPGGVSVVLRDIREWLDHREQMENAALGRLGDTSDGPPRPRPYRIGGGCGVRSLYYQHVRLRGANVKPANADLMSDNGIVCSEDEQREILLLQDKAAKPLQ